MRILTVATLLTLVPSSALAAFDWGSDCQPGSGEFSQYIPSNATTVVGTIPEGKANVRIDLSSTNDVDIQLYDAATGEAIVEWPGGILGGSSSSGAGGCTDYQGVEICYSGYDGDPQGAQGKEWIQINGTTNRALVMKAFGYRAGDAHVTYSFEAPADCVPLASTGSGTFTQDVSQGQIVALGDIPAGLKNVRIKLTAPSDVDVQLYAGATPLIKWARSPALAGLLGRSPKPEGDYYGDVFLDYSGYNGDQTSGGRGNEFVNIIGDIPADLTMSVYGYAAGSAKVDYAWGVDDFAPGTDYVRSVKSRDVFDAFAHRDDTPGAMGLRELKFLITGVNTPSPELYLMNMSKWNYHYELASDVLGLYSSVSAFNPDTYWSDSRKNLAGTVMAYDNYAAPSGELGLYGIEFWPTDPVSPELIGTAASMLKAAMPIASEKLAYHPNSETQLAIYEENQAAFEQRGIRTVTSSELFGNLAYSPLNLGEGYGKLRVVGQGDTTPSYGDVVIFTYVPNDLPHVAGIITDSPQTPLSHINLKAKQNNTPNAYVKDAAAHPSVVDFIGTLVHYVVGEEGFTLEAATQDEVDAWLAHVRPQHTQTPESDLTTYTTPQPLSRLHSSDWISFGAKAANVAELGHLFRGDDTVDVPDGFAVPFAMYDAFMRLPRCTDNRKLCAPGDSGPSFYEQAEAMMASAGFHTDITVREGQLKGFRKDIKKGEVPAQMVADLEDIRLFWDPAGAPFQTSLRVRSSTNAEDLEGFNGAGLYDSYTHKPDEGDLAKSIKQVWSARWTLRAHDELNFYRIDPFKTYMGVLVHPNFGDEQVNGVAVTKNIYDQNWAGYYVNAQYGEISVTNPTPIWGADGKKSTSVPDEFLVSDLPNDEDAPYEVQYIRRSNVELIYQNEKLDEHGDAIEDADGDTVLEGGQPVPTLRVLKKDEIAALHKAMEKIQAHFKAIYSGNSSFAMDLEFKITETVPYDAETGTQPPRGRLAIKQARPWVD